MSWFYGYLGLNRERERESRGWVQEEGQGLLPNPPTGIVH